MIEKIVYFDDVQICTESIGASYNETILLIMGATASMIWWEEEFCERLSGYGFRVIRYDNRDVGKSTTYKFGFPEYSFEDLADDAVKILDFYEVEKAHIVGMSMGGIIAQIIALKYSHRVSSISLVMTSNFDPNLPSKDIKITEKLNELTIKNWNDKNEVVNILVEKSKLFVGPKNNFDEEKIRRLNETAFDRASNMESMNNHGLIKGYKDYLNRTSEITAPTLVIHGTEDPIIPYVHGVHLSNIIKNSVFLSIEGTGHEIHRNDWEIIIDAIVTQAKNSK